MAESILKLKVSSEEYDNKLKRAADGLTRYADECRKVGGTLEVVEKDTLDYVRALGQMDATSRTATGKLAEMKKTFTELSVQYKNLTDAEKASPFGRALESSLSQLKGRISESKQQLDDITRDINGSNGLSGALDNLAAKFGVNIKTLASWGTALAAGKAALDVAKDAFFANESAVDEWGRTVESGKSLYEGFLTALNTGDISGYLSRIDTIVKAAREAYNELDRLGTMKTIQGPQMSAQQTENERMRMMIQTGRYIAPVDGRRASMKNGQILTPEQIKRIEQQLQNGMQKIVSLVSNEVHQTGRAIDAVYNRQSKELGMSLKEFRKGTSTMAEFDKRMEGYEKYKAFEAAHTTTAVIQSSAGAQVRSHRDNVTNPYAQYAKWGVFRVDGERYNDLVKLIQQRDQQAGQAYSMQSQAYRTMNRAEGLTLRQIMNGVTGGGGGTTTTTKGGKTVVEEKKKEATFQQIIAGLEKEAMAATGERYDTLVRLIRLYDSAIAKEKEMRSQMHGTNEERDEFQEWGPLDEWNDQLKSLRTAQSHAQTREEYASYGEQIRTTQKNIDEFTGGNDKESGLDKLIKDIDKGNELYSKAVGGISNIVGGMQQLGVEIPEGLSNLLNALGGISTILTGISSILSFISVVTSAKPFALGGAIRAATGVVAGRNFSGDTVPALLNSGEVVLNRAEVGTLAQSLENGNRNESVDRQPYVTGEYIFLGLNNYLRGSGKGSIVTAKQ